MKGTPVTFIFDLLVLWIFICLFRSLLDLRGSGEIKQLFFYNYSGISLFPVLFFIVGININYFFLFNRIIFIYIIIVSLLSLFFVNYFEIQIFLLMPLFYVILTLPLRSGWNKLLILLISVFVVIVSLTNRAGIMRLMISYCIIAAYYVMLNIKIHKRLLNIAVFCILMIPVFSLYLGMQGESVFQIVLGEDTQPYSQLDPYSDTRTFLYFEVFQDLMHSKAHVFGKGLNAGYYSESFGTFSRGIVEVGFLQILLKTGILGTLLYLSVIISAIFKALSKSRNLFIKSLGFLLASYVLMLFLENVVAYNLLNIVTWIVVGMCHSEKIRELSNEGIRDLFNNIHNNSAVI